MNSELSVTEQKRQHKELISSIDRAVKQLSRIADALEQCASGQYVKNNLKYIMSDKEKFEEVTRNLFSGTDSIDDMLVKKLNEASEKL